MVISVNYEDAQTQMAALIEAAMRGDKVVITKNGRQIIQLVPMKPAHKPTFGSAKGKIKFASDFNTPLSDFSEYMP